MREIGKRWKETQLFKWKLKKYWMKHRSGAGIQWHSISCVISFSLLFCPCAFHSNSFFFLIFLRSDIFFRCHLSSCKMPVEFQNCCYFLLRLTNQQTTTSQAPRRGKVYFARPPWRQIGFNVMFFLWFIFTCCQTSVLLLPFMTVMPKAEAMAKDTTWLIDLNSLGHAYF